MRCRACNAYIPEGATHCLECGAGLEPELVCQRCGAAASPSARFCRKCGAPLTPWPAARPPEPVPRSARESVLGDSQSCSRCGSAVPSGTLYCPSCGLSQASIQPKAESSDHQETSVEGDATEPAAGANPCPVCGAELRGSARFCHECGRFLGTDIEHVICPACGADHSLRYSRCQYCGAEIPRPQKPLT
jgi:ribosomal protein L40E